MPNIRSILGLVASLLFTSSVQAGLFIDLRFPDGSTTKQITTPDVGTSIPIQVWARITNVGGTNGTGTQFGLQYAFYNVTSSTTGGGIAGGLSSPSLVTPFTASGPQPGTIQSITPDGINDLGSTNTTSLDGNFADPRASSAVFTSSGLGQTQHLLAGGAEFLVETVNFNVTANTIGATTQFGINLPSFFATSIPPAANWWQNSTGSISNGANNGTFSAGTGITFSGVSDPQWNINGSGNWSTTSNWNPNLSPNAAKAVVNFGTVPTVPVTVTVDTAKTAGVLNFNNANAYTISGTNAITLDNGTSSAAINVTQGNHQISAPLTLAQNLAVATTNGSVNLSGSLNNAASKSITKTGAGTLTLSGTQTHGSSATLVASGGTVNLNTDAGSVAVRNLAVTVNSTATLNLNVSQDLKSLTVNSGGAVALLAAAHNPYYLPGNKHLTVDTLAVKSGGTFDLRDGLVAIANEGTGGANDPTMTQMLQSGSLFSSTANNDINGLVGIGMMHNSGSYAYLDPSTNELLVDNVGHPSAVAIPNGPNSVVAKYTYYGDIDLNGKVDGDDLTVFFSTYGQSLLGWENGDFDYNGIINGDDLTVFFAAYGSHLGDSAFGQGPPLGPGTVVPEPASFWLLALGLLGSTAAIRSRRSQ